MKRSLQVILLFMLLLSPFSVAENGYVVQVGDVIRISLPGESDVDTTFDVDRLGRIYLPEIGAVNLAGKEESQLKSVIKKELEAVYQDLLNLHVYVYKRQLLVNVLGYVQNPGEVTVPANANIQEIIEAAGGLRAGAQLDRIILRRQKQSIKFNYKEYLDSGDAETLPQVKSLDVLFVPASPKIGNVEVQFDPSKIADSGDASDAKQAIKVFGEVNSPGSFTYNQDITILDLLMRAGGVTRYAGVEQIRVINQGEPYLFNLKNYLDSGDKSLLPKITPGDTIFIPKEEEAVKSGANTVYIMGEVFKPGAYESQPGASFLDILANSGGPTRYAESRQIRILKSGGEVIRFDLAAYTEGTSKQTIPLIMPGDAIFIPEKTDMNEKSWLKITPDRAVRVIGEVVRPGRVEWSDEMSFLDLLAHVGGPVSRADTTNIEISMPTENGSNKVTIFNLDEFINSGAQDSQLPKITAGTTIRVHDLPQDPSDNKAQWVRQSSEKSIYIFGQVGAPGRYMFNNDMSFLDILSAADGPTKDADLHNIRISHRNKKVSMVSKLNLALYFETGDENLLPEVKAGDSIYIPEKDRLWIDQPKELTVRVLGAVRNPGRYRFSDEMTILDLLAEAGGTNGDALVKKISIVNLSCCKDQARTFNLVKFSKTGNFASLPVLREGDTIYVPNKKDGKGHKIREGVSDVVRLVSLGILFGL